MTDKKVTIKELAKEYGEENPNIVFSADDVSDDTETPALDFEAGANAVLEEIENILATEFIAGRVATDRLRLLEIYNKIKELKGE